LKSATFTLGKNTGAIQDDSTAGNQPVYGNGTLKKTLSFYLPVPKVLTYDQDESTPRTVGYPNNYAPFCVVGYHHQDLSPPDEYYQDVTFTARANMWYDDA